VQEDRQQNTREVRGSRGLVEAPHANFHYSQIVDWKLVYRDPLPTWVSPERRTALLGDSAHPFLPTSAQGATQSMEDGVTLAVCLRKAGKENVREAVKAYMDIR
jgi:2-polyprenyl-6-methoxyphenol hydroxylase-like FAD-dependent oxidoreductase